MMGSNCLSAHLDKYLAGAVFEWSYQTNKETTEKQLVEDNMYFLGIVFP